MRGLVGGLRPFDGVCDLRPDIERGAADDPLLLLARPRDAAQGLAFPGKIKRLFILGFYPNINLISTPTFIYLGTFSYSFVKTRNANLQVI